MSRTPIARKRAPSATDGGWRTIRFEVPSSIGSRHVELIAEFLGWTPFALDRRPDGSFSATVRLRRGRTWGYHFLLDGETPMADATAEHSRRLADGTAISLLRT